MSCYLTVLRKSDLFFETISFDSKTQLASFFLDYNLPDKEGNVFSLEEHKEVAKLILDTEPSFNVVRKSYDKVDIALYIKDYL